jgi:hypothetical protein
MGKQRIKPNYRRRVLRLPDLDHCKFAVLNSLGSPASRRVYEYAIDQFIAWYCSEPRLALNRIVVVRYRLYLESRHLAANTINQQLAAVRRLAHEAADSGLLSPELAAGISRVKGVKQLGFRSGNWLSAEQSSEVLKHAGETPCVPSAIMRCWPCCLVVAFAGRNLWAWGWMTSRCVRGTGRWWT